MALSIHKELIRGVILFVELAGELDLGTSPMLHETLEEAAAANRHNLLISLEKVSFMDCSGLSVLIQAQRELHRLGGTLAVLCTNPSIKRMLTVTGLDRIFLVSENVEGAMKSAQPALSQCLDCALFCGIPNCPVVRSLAYPGQPCDPATEHPWLEALQHNSAEIKQKRRLAVKGFPHPKHPGK